MDCPNCKLVNPPTAERCDCGYDFATCTIKQSYLTERDRQLSKPLITGTVLVVYLVVRAVLGAARAAQERSVAPLVLTLLAVAVVLFWLFRRKGRWW